MSIMEIDEDLYEDILNEVRKQTLDTFELERLQSFYNNNQDIALPAFQALSVAKKLIHNHPSAAHIFAVIAIEVGLKDVLLKPLISGLLINASFSEIIASAIIGNKGLDRIKPLLKIILEHPKITDINNASIINLDTYRRSGINKNYWEELTEIYKTRNKILHKAVEVDEETAQHAYVVASTFFNDLFHEIIKSLGFDYSFEEDGKIK